MTIVNNTRPRWILHGCSRCRGDLYRQAEQYGDEWQCLLCGWSPNHQDALAYVDPHLLPKARLNSKLSHRDAGRLGGLQTYMRYGADFMREMGKKGGRPRVKLLSELRQQTAPRDENKLEGGIATHQNNLRVLKELWRNKAGERCPEHLSPEGA